MSKINQTGGRAMTDGAQEPDEQISDILAAIYLAGTENGLGRQLTDPAEIMHRKEAFINANPASTEAKQAILDWHNKQIEAELEALREEVKHEDLRTISQIITARIDKLKESSND